MAGQNCEDQTVNIKIAADISQLPVKTIRYYEDIGLVVPPRAGNGYRRYNQSDLHKLTFIGRARSLGFTVQDCRTLLSLYEDQSRASADVKRLAEEHVGRIESKIEELQTMLRALAHLVNSCHGDDRPDCPILDGLASGRDVSDQEN
jgi:MerR family transcriptional regulator, copper efflux regulator